jgi:hypothetical protein
VHLTLWTSGDELDALAAAYAETGQFVAAVRYGTMAVEATNCLGFNDAFRKRLESYKQRKPYRSST